MTAKGSSEEPSARLTRGRRSAVLAAVVGALVVAGGIGVVIDRWLHWYEYTDFANLVLLSEIEVGEEHVQATFSPDGARLYLLDEPQIGSGVIFVIDVAKRSVLDRIGLQPGFPLQIVAAPDGKSVLVSVSGYRGGKKGGRKGTNRLDFIDTATNTVTATLPVSGYAVGGLIVSEDSKMAYLTDRVLGTVYRIDLATRALTTRLALPNGPYGATFDTRSDLAYFVSTRIGKESVVTAIDTRTDASVGAVAVGLGRCTSGSQVLLSRDGHRLYVSHTKDRRIAVVDTNPASPQYHELLEFIPTPGERITRMRFNRERTLALVCVDQDQFLLLDTKPESWSFHKLVGTLSMHRPCVDFVVHAPVEVEVGFEAVEEPAAECSF